MIQILWTSMLCYAMLCYVRLCYVMLCYVMLCYAMLCFVILCYDMLCYVMLCYAMLCYAMQRYAMLCYAMLCYVRMYLCHPQHFNCTRYITQWKLQLWFRINHTKTWCSEYQHFKTAANSVVKSRHRHSFQINT